MYYHLDSVSLNSTKVCSRKVEENAIFFNINYFSTPTINCTGHLKCYDKMHIYDYKKQLLRLLKYH